MENTALRVSLWLSEKPKEETLKYLINDSAEAFEPCNEGFASTIHSPATEPATQTAVIQITSDSRNWFSFLFSSSEAELAGSYLEIFQNYFHLSF